MWLCQAVCVPERDRLCMPMKRGEKEGGEEGWGSKQGLYGPKLQTALNKGTRESTHTNEYLQLPNTHCINIKKISYMHEITPSHTLASTVWIQIHTFCSQLESCKKPPIFPHYWIPNREQIIQQAICPTVLLEKS